MTDREKLIEWIKEIKETCRQIDCDDCEYSVEHGDCQAYLIADCLISKGVTIPDSKLITNASTAFTLMDFKADGTAMAIGKVSEIPDTFEIGLDILVEKDATEKGKKNESETFYGY